MQITGQVQSKQKLRHELKNTAIYQALKEMSPEEVDTYIDTNITDLPSAKQFLKKLTKIVVWLFQHRND